MADQYPDPQGASISIPNLVTQLNDQTGPQAQAADFAPNMSGLAQGLGEASQSLDTIADRGMQRQHASDTLWALSASEQADKDWSEKLVAAQTNGTPFDPEQFDAQYQADIDKRLQGAPTDGARIIAEKQMTRQGTSMFKQNLVYNAQFIAQQRQVQATSIAASIEQKVRSGEMTADEGMAAIVGLNSTVKSVVPGMGQIAGRAGAAITQEKMAQISNTAGPGALAQQIRTTNLGAPYMSDTDRETVATQADNQQTTAVDTRIAIAQKKLSQINSATANGGSVSPADRVTASAELAAAVNAKPIVSEAPPLADVFSAGINKWDTALAQSAGPFSKIEANSLKNIEVASLGRLGQQRLLGMNPEQARSEIYQLQDRFGVGDDAGGTLVRHLALYQAQNEKRLALVGEDGKSNPAFDPQAVAFQSPDIQAQMTAAQQALSTAQTPADKGAAKQLMNIAIESSLSFQRRLGVRDSDARVMTNAQAAQYGGKMQTAQDYQNTFGQIKDQYGDYGTQAIKQVASVKGSVPGGVQLAMLGSSQTSWAGAAFAEKPDETTAKTIQTAIGDSKDFSQYIASNQSDLRNAQQNIDYTNGFQQQVYYRMKQFGMTPDQAMKSAFSDTIGSFWTVAKTDGDQPINQGWFGTGFMGKSRTIALPKSIAENSDVASDIQNKGNVALQQLQQGGFVIDSSAGEAPGITDADRWKVVSDQGYWVYDANSRAIMRYVHGPLGDAPVMLAHGRPLGFDAYGLKSSNVVESGDPNLGSRGSQFTMTPTGVMIPNTAIQGNGQPVVTRKLDSNPIGLVPQAPSPAPPGPILKPVPAPKGQPQASNLEDKLPESMKSLAPLFEKYGNANGIDPRLLAAISMHETGRGTSKAFRQGNNAMGVSNSHGPLAFNSVEDSISHQAHTLATSPLYAKFRRTGAIADLGATYAPVGAENDPSNLNPDWIGGVSNLYSGLM